MSANMRLIIDNVHDSETLTATSEALPVDYTQRSGRSYVWRSSDLSGQVITAQLDSTSYIDAVVLYRHNLYTTATARVELLYNGDVVYDSGTLRTSELIPPPRLRIGIDSWGATYDENMPVLMKPIWVNPTRITGYRITLSDPDNPDGYMQIGRIISGISFSPEYNPAYGLQLEWQESVEHRRTEAGSLRSIGGGLARRLALDLNFLSDADRTKLTTELVKRGKGSDVFISVYPEQGGIKEVEHSFLARRDDNYSHTHNFYANWQSSLPFVEV